MLQRILERIEPLVESLASLHGAGRAFLRTDHEGRLPRSNKSL